MRWYEPQVRLRRTKCKTLHPEFQPQISINQVKALRLTQQFLHESCTYAKSLSVFAQFPPMHHISSSGPTALAQRWPFLPLFPLHPQHAFLAPLPAAHDDANSQQPSSMEMTRNMVHLLHQTRFSPIVSVELKNWFSETIPPLPLSPQFRTLRISSRSTLCAWPVSSR